MSYEGYVVYYCENGHRVATLDAMEVMYEGRSDLVCEVCGSKVMVEDHVDQTNGCFCDQLPAEKRPCHSHERPLTQVGWTSTTCPQCDGTRSVEVVLYYEDAKCSCKGVDGTCRNCFGTSHLRIAGGTTMANCPRCRGTGLVWEEKYDLTPLLKKAARE